MKKNILIILGIVLLILGVVGFFNDPVFGIFDVDLGHNLVHLFTGLFSLYFAYRDEVSQNAYGIIMTLVYGIVLIWGLAMPDSEALGFIAVNGADNILHLILTASFGFVGFYNEVRMHNAASARAK